MKTLLASLVVAGLFGAGLLAIPSTAEANAKCLQRCADKYPSPGNQRNFCIRNCK